MKKKLILVSLLFCTINIYCQYKDDKSDMTYSKFNIHGAMGLVSSYPLFRAGISYRINKSFSTDVEFVGISSFLLKDRIIGVNFHFKPNSGLIMGLIHAQLNTENEHLYSLVPHIGYIFYNPEYLPSLKFSIGYGPAYFKVDNGRKDFLGVLNVDIVLGFQFYNKKIKK